MPDLVTHCSVAYFFMETSKFPRNPVLFYVGTILPDILTRPFYIVHAGLYPIVTPFHTPVVLLLICLLASFLFAEGTRKTVFFSLLGGCYLHIMVDLTQRHILPEYFVFLPFSWKTFEFGIIWPESWFYIMPFLVLGMIFNEIRKAVLQRKRGICEHS